VSFVDSSSGGALLPRLAFTVRDGLFFAWGCWSLLGSVRVGQARTFQVLALAQLYWFGGTSSCACRAQ
jgi:hypothetical protein